MFDFDDIEERDPADVSIRCMPEDEFEDLPVRLKAAIRNRRYEDIAFAYAEAISDQKVVSERMPKILELLKSLLSQAAGQSPPDFESGAAIVWSLWQMSLSTSLYETRVRSSEADGADTALLLGFGGSDVEDLEPQAAWYHGRGLTAISTSRVVFPPDLSKKQDMLVAEALRDSLKGGGGVVLHVCSQHGLFYAAHLLWLWSCGHKPFDSFPPLEQRLKAIVFDCSAPPDFNAQTRTLEYPTEREATASRLPELQDRAQLRPRPTPSEPGHPTPALPAKVPVTGENDPPSIKSQTKFYTPVVLNCIGALCLKWKVRALESLFLDNKHVRPCVVAGARFTSVPQPWLARLQESDPRDAGGPSDAFAAFQLLDWKVEPAVPRLFLHSEKDAIISAERVEAFIKHTQAYRPEAVVQQGRLTKSAHCKNWTEEPEECAAAVSKLLELAKIPVQAMGA